MGTKPDRLIPRMAPSFELPDQDGNPRKLSDFLANGPVVIVFYPGDFTPVCTKQLCSYRDAGDEFRDLGVQIVGISSDPPEKHHRFREQFKFEFPLLSDPDRSIAKAFGATSKWLLGGVTRANFIVSIEGKIVFEQVEGLPVTHHKVENLSEALRRLRAENKI